ncbi:MAG TPA: rhomboid family intramembrane serine protease [Mycobacteriales bacterium]|nr:rhomboid family intramembrane serine protease [Mycobacteriales bacterium]
MGSIPAVPGGAVAPVGRSGRADRLGSWRGAAVAVAVVLGVLWAVELVNVVTGDRLDSLGIRPRSLVGIPGILAAPLLHASVSHLLDNTVLLAVLGWIGLVGNSRRFVAVTGIAWVASGLGAWLLGASGSVVVGASGVVYGWLAYLIVRGWVAHRLSQAVLGVALLVFVGFSAIWGVLPLTAANVSWQGHLFGAAGGVLGALLLDARRTARPRPVLPVTPTLPTLPGPPGE